MNLEELKKSGYIIFKCIAGSHSYGLQNINSDIDERGLYILPLNQRLSILNFDQEIGNEKQDIKYYDIHKYFKLAIDCNPNIIELLWTPDDCIKFKNEKMDKIIAHRDLFISKKAYHTFSGYSIAQISKATGRHKLINNPKPKDPPRKEDFCRIIPLSLWNEYKSRQCGFRADLCYIETMCNDLELAKFIANTPCRPIEYSRLSKIYDLSKFHVASLEHVPNTYRLYYYGVQSKGVFRGDQMLVECESISLDDERDRFVGLLVYSEQEYEKELKAWKNYHNWVRERNESRWKDQENKVVSYDQKNMLHCFRLLYSGKNILEFGFPIVRFEGKQREFLMDIRKNKFTYEYLMELVKKEMKELDELKETSTLPWGCNVKKVNELYLELIK